MKQKTFYISDYSAAVRLVEDLKRYDKFASFFYYRPLGIFVVSIQPEFLCRTCGLCR